MMNKIHAFALAFMCIGGLTSPVRGESQHLLYEAYWSGFHIADFSLSLTHEGARFENNFQLQSRGLTYFFSHLSATAVSQGTVGNGAFFAEHYRTEYTNRKHFRWVDINFGKPDIPATATTGTAPIPGLESRWNPKDKGPEVLEKVQEEMRINVNDPISLVPQVMNVARSYLLGGATTATARGFDGRRRFDMHITFVGKIERTVNKIRQSVYHLRIIPKPVAGFKDRHKILWNNAAYDFFLSTKGDFAPLQIFPVKHGPVLTLISRCDQKCQLPTTAE